MQTVTQYTLPHKKKRLFPHLLGGQGYRASLAKQLLKTRLELPCRVCFEWDEVLGRVVRLETEVDFALPLAGLTKLLSDSEKVSCWVVRPAQDGTRADGLSHKPSASSISQRWQGANDGNPPSRSSRSPYRSQTASAVACRRVVRREPTRSGRSGRHLPVKPGNRKRRWGQCSLRGGRTRRISNRARR
jgi:hypothetical protein